MFLIYCRLSQYTNLKKIPDKIYLLGTKIFVPYKQNLIGDDKMMFLEKLEIQGFKSFASKNALKFPGFLDKEKRGLTAVVGPNGSGKSNVADAIRWALGEQSMKTLRGKKSEDIIFSGTEKKGKLGMAEVSLFLNNADGVKASRNKEELSLDKQSAVEELIETSSGEETEGATETGKKNNSKKTEKALGKISPLDLSEIVITRRLYRSGDSEYIINNQKVRLSDIQMFLAKAKFGQKTYSVIGQGTVEGFLNTTMSERKEFFDEATGVKQFQIKRDDSLNKLRSSYENLQQAQMLIVEIEPRLKSLTRQVNRLNKRGELERELKEIQLKYYSRTWHEIDAKFRDYNSRYLELETEKREKDKKLEALNRQMEEMEKISGASEEFARLQKLLAETQREKDRVNRELARLEAQLEVKLEAKGKFDLSFLISKKEELKREEAKVLEDSEILKNELETLGNLQREIDREKSAINAELGLLNKALMEASRMQQPIANKEANASLEKVLEKITRLKTEEDIAKLRILIEEIEKELLILIRKETSKEIKEEPKVSKEWQAVQEKIEKVSQVKEEILSRFNDNRFKISSIEEKLRLLKEKKSEVKEELDRILEKLDQNTGEIDFAEIEEKKQALILKIKEIDDDLYLSREKFNALNREEEAKKAKTFALQKDLHSVQNEVNILSGRLNDISISSARYETKLEGLEAEIREELSDLKIVKEEEAEIEIDMDQAKARIGDLKRQLELIGGIDPQAESEFEETKERFDFLSGQINDFHATVKSMEKIIKELDVTIKERFDREFKLIAHNFEKYFKILFNGGSAKIVKVMEDVLLKEEALVNGEGAKKDDKSIQSPELSKIKYLQKHNATGLAGVEIEACPPGKRIASIAMLSGGERALTAIALICAIISANPSPFVVLDEVDAALDEANSERLAKILDELSHKTQFIVITHNRASMRRANILYGVTMGDDGASKLLSIKLEEASSQAKN